MTIPASSIPTRFAASGGCTVATVSARPADGGSCGGEALQILTGKFTSKAGWVTATKRRGPKSTARACRTDAGLSSWVDVVEVSGPLVRFRWTWVFASDGAVLTSDSTLRFRTRDEVAAGLVAGGFAVDEVRDAPDRPGRELVFFARRPE